MNASTKDNTGDFITLSVLDNQKPREKPLAELIDDYHQSWDQENEEHISSRIYNEHLDKLLSDEHITTDALKSALSKMQYTHIDGSTLYYVLPHEKVPDNEIDALITNEQKSLAAFDIELTESGILELLDKSYWFTKNKPLGLTIQEDFIVTLERAEDGEISYISTQHLERKKEIQFLKKMRCPSNDYYSVVMSIRSGNSSEEHPVRCFRKIEEAQEYIKDVELLSATQHKYVWVLNDRKIIKETWHIPFQEELKSSFIEHNCGLVHDKNGNVIGSDMIEIYSKLVFNDSYNLDGEKLNLKVQNVDGETVYAEPEAEVVMYLNANGNYVSDAQEYTYATEE